MTEISSSIFSSFLDYLQSAVFFIILEIPNFRFKDKIIKSFYQARDRQNQNRFDI